MNRSTLALALSLVLIGGCVDRQKQAAAKATEKFTSAPVQAVSVTPAATRTLRETVEITGDITTGADVSVSARAGGRLEAVYVKDGDRVSQGQVIAVLDRVALDAGVRQAQAQIASARAGLQQALNNAALRPAQSASAVASARQQARAAEAGLRQARTRLALALAGPRAEERRQAQAQLNSAKSNLDTQKKQLDRIRNLVREGALAGNQLDIQQATYDQALAAYRSAQETIRTQTNGTRPEDIESARQTVRQAQAQYASALEGIRSAQATQRLDVTLQDAVATARANVEQAEAGLRIARQNIDDASVRAPFSGIVNGIPLQVGTVVSPGVAIARLVGEGGAYFEGTVPDALVDRVQAGQRVEVTVSPGNAKFDGAIAAISPLGDAVSRQFRARVTVNGDRTRLRPGLFARGRVILREIPGAVAIPVLAIVKQGDRNIVFTAEGKKAKAVPVELGLKEGDFQEVRGLAVGTPVVTAGQTTLKDGAVIEIAKPAAPATGPTAAVAPGAAAGGN